MMRDAGNGLGWRSAAAVGGVIWALAAGGGAGWAADAPGATTASGGAPAAEALTINALLGTVEGTPIFSDDVLNPIDVDLRRMLRLAKSRDDFMWGAKSAVNRQLNMMINDAFIFKAAKDAITDEDKQKFDAIMVKMRKDLLTQYGGSQALAEAALRARGSSIDKELAGQKRQAMIDYYRHKTLWPKISVTRQDVLGAYQRDLATKYTVPDEVDLYTITLRVERFLKEPDPEHEGHERTIKDPTAAQVKEAENRTVELAKKLIGQIKGGADFVQLVEDYSADGQKQNGGRWPHTRKGMLASSELEKAAFSLAANTIGEPLVLANDDPHKSAVVVVRVGQTTPGHVVSFAQAQLEIERKLKEEQWVTLSNEFNEKLIAREKDTIEELEQNMVETATKVAVARYWASSGASEKE